MKAIINTNQKENPFFSLRVAKKNQYKKSNWIKAQLIQAQNIQILI